MIARAKKEKVEIFNNTNNMTFMLLNKFSLRRLLYTIFVFHEKHCHQIKYEETINFLRATQQTLEERELIATASFIRLLEINTFAYVTLGWVKLLMKRWEKRLMAAKDSVDCSFVNQKCVTKLFEVFDAGVFMSNCHCYLNIKPRLN